MQRLAGMAAELTVEQKEGEYLTQNGKRNDQKRPLSLKHKVLKINK